MPLDRIPGQLLAASLTIDHRIFWIGPLVGGGLAGIVYEFAFLRPRSDEEYQLTEGGSARLQRTARRDH